MHIMYFELFIISIDYWLRSKLFFSLYAPITSNECQVWFHLYWVSRAVRSTEQAKNTKWKIVVYSGTRNRAVSGSNN